MSRRNSRRALRSHSHSIFSRRRQARRSHALFEALEKRQLLSAAQPYSFNNVGIGGTGTDYWANVNPKNVNDIYMETDMGGVWHSTNDGQTWQVINTMSAIASDQGDAFVQFTSNQNTQYALSGGNSTAFPWEPTMTTNDGQTWSVLPGWSSISANGQVSNVVADPNNTTDIIVSQSKSVGGNWNYWYWYSSNSGQSFQLITSNTTGTNPYEDWIAGTFWDPTNTNDAYIATNFGIFSTSNLSSSTPTWTITTPTFSTTNEALFSFTGSDQGGTTRLWAVTDQLSNFTVHPTITNAAWSVSLYTSSNGGSSWTNMTSSGPVVGGVQQPWNDTATNTANLRIEWVQMIDGNTNDIWIGGEDYTYHGEYQGAIVYETTNAGTSWNRLLQTGSDQTYFPGIAPDANVYTHIYGSLAGLAGWGMGSAVTFLVNRANPNIITFTVQDTVFESIDGGANWYDIDSGGPEVEPNSFWNPEGTDINPNQSVPTSSMEETTTWNQTFLSPTTIFTDNTDVTFEKSTDGGATWNFPNFLGAQPNSFYQSAYQASTGMLYAVSSDKHNLFNDGFTNNGEVEQFAKNYFVQSADGGETWQIDYIFPFSSPSRTLTLDPNNPDVAFVGTQNHVEGSGGIWMTTDLQDGANATWTYLGQNSGGAGATGTAIMGTGANAGTIVSVSITNQGSGYSSNTAYVDFSDGGEQSSADQALGIPVVNGSGHITSVTMISDGTGYSGTTAANVTFGVGEQPMRNGSFSAMRPYELYVLNQDNGNPNNITLVALMGLRTLVTGASTDNSGVWTGTTTDGGTTWTWTDDSDPSVSTFTYNGQSIPNDIPVEASNLTIDPNDPTQKTWFVTMEDGTVSPTGYIYETTNAGASWSVYSTAGQGEDFWIQPGGTEALFAAKNSGVDFVPNYQAANPQFYQEQNFPFSQVMTIVSNPYNSNQVWFDAFGTGMWETDLSQLGLPAVPLNVTAQTVSSSEIMVGWTIQSPVPSSYVIEAATNSSFTSGTVTATVSNWQASSYLFTGLSSDTEYYFRVEAVNSTGGASLWSNAATFQDSSIGSARTDAAAGLIASEAFSYTSGNSLNGQSGGTGWASGSSWSAGSDKIVAAITGFPNTVPTGGNAADVTTSATRTMASSVGQSGTVLWAAFEENVQSAHTSLLMGNTTNGFAFGAPNNPQGNGKNNPGFEIISSGSSTYINANGTVTFSPGSSHFFVAEMDFESNGTYVNLYLDPAAGLSEPPMNTSSEVTWETPPSSLAGATIINNGLTLYIPTAAWQPTATNTITLQKTGDFGAVRLGNTYADVAPLAQSSPAAPTNLVAGPDAFNPSSTNATSYSVNPNEIDLTWTNNAAGNQTGEIIQQSGGGSGWTTIAKLIDPSSLVSSYSVTDLSPSTAYKFQVETYNSAGNSSFDTSSSTTTNAAVPAAVSNLAASATNGQVNLTWAAASGASGYVLQYTNQSYTAADDGDLNWTSVNVSSGTTSSYTLSGLGANATYYFRILPYSSGGTAFCSNLVSASVLAAPTSVTATGVGSGQVQVAWTDTTQDITGYNVQYSTNGTSGWISGGSTSGSQDGLIVTGLSADTQYYFEVQATGNNSTGVWSSAIAGRTLNTSASPLVYEGFTYPAGSDPGGQTGGFGWSGGWTDVSGDSAFVIGSSGLSYANQVGTGNDWAAGSNDNISRNFSSSYGGSSSGGVYWSSALVEPLDSSMAGTVELAGSGTSGAVISFGFYENHDFSFNVSKASLTQTTGVAGTVGDTYLVVLEVNYAASGSTTLTMWVDPTGFGSSGPTGSLATVSATTTYSLPALTNVTIKGATSADSENWDEFRLGTSFEAAAPLPVPAIPTNLMATAGASSITLSWTESPTTNVAGYDIQRSTNDSTWNNLATGVTTTTYIDSSAVGGTEYYYRVSSEDVTGDSVYSATANATIGSQPGAPTGLTATPGTSTITLNWTDPNPNSNVTGYHIWRSTNDVFGSTSYATVSGSSAVSYTDNSVGSGTNGGTTYYYEVTAYNGSGDSSPATIPGGLAGGVATVYAHEGFNYPTSSTWTGTGTTGIGFTRNWSVSNTNNASIVTGLGYSSGTSTLTTAGNAVDLIDNVTATQTLDGSGVGAAGHTLWVGFEINAVSGGGSARGLQIGVSGTNGGEVSFEWVNSTIEEEIVTNTNNVYSPTGYAATGGTTYFVVGEIQYLTASPVITLYVDPTPDSANGSSPANYLFSTSKTVPSTAGILSPTTALSIFNLTTSDSTTLDEIRLGATYASVAPDPILTGSTAPGKKHRRSPFLSVVAATGKSSEILSTTKPASTNLNYFYAALNGGSWRWANAVVDDDNLLTAASNDAATGSWQGFFN